MNISQEWSSFSIEASGSTRENQLTSLRVKINRHLKSTAHKIAETIETKKKDNEIVCSLSKATEINNTATDKISGRVESN